MCYYDLQGHRLASFLPAITAILVVLLEGAVSDLPQDMQQELSSDPVPSRSQAPQPGQDADVSTSQAHQPPSAEGQLVEDPSASADKQEGGRDAGSEEGRTATATMTAGVAEATPTATAPGPRQGPQGPAHAQKGDGGREVRSGVLRLLASVWSRFPAQYHDSPVFGRFFAAVRPLMRRIATEVCLHHMPSQHLIVRSSAQNLWRLGSCAAMHDTEDSLQVKSVLIWLSFVISSST